MIIKKYKYFVYFFLLSSLTIASAQSMQELQKLKAQYEKAKNSNLNSPELESQNLDFNRDLQSLPQEAQIKFNNIAINKLPYDELQHFGYDFFTKRDSVSFWENLPTPSNYLLGPGDELIISLWGETHLRNTYIITREGTIYDDKVGLLNIAGRTVLDARDYLLMQYGRVYATLKTKNPSTYLDISLGKLRLINVNFVGQVNYPGIYPVHPFSSLITGLMQAGGVDTSGSLREIQIKRNGSLLGKYDLYDFFINGDISSSMQLRDQDVVIVPPRKSLITIDSAVVKPGYYESIIGETIFDMINYSGGLRYDASGIIGLYRLKPMIERKTESVYLSSYVSLEATKLIPVNIGDQIIARAIFDEINQVEILGQVKEAGAYHYFDGMTFKDILKLGGGFKDATFIKSIYLKKAEIIRRNPGSRYDRVIAVNIEKHLINKNENILLQNLDKVIIHANLNFFEKENIQILGEVNIPGSYPLIADNESLESIILRAGALTTKALKDGISIYRHQKYFETNLFIENPEDRADVKESKPNLRVRVAWKNRDIALMPGDSVIVKEKTATIYVSGSVYNPGVQEFRSGKSYRYYINAAGGLTDNANKKGIIVLYANGIVSPKKWYSSPKVLEGSTIIINKKAEEEPFNATQFATNWTSIISSMITAIVLSQQIATN